MLLPQISQPLVLKTHKHLHLSNFRQAKRRRNQALLPKTTQSRFGNYLKNLRQLLKRIMGNFMGFITVLGLIPLKLKNKKFQVFLRLGGLLEPMFKMFLGKVIRNWLVSFP